MVQARDAILGALWTCYVGRAPMTVREIATVLIAGKAVPATRKQFMDLTAAIHAALRKRDGITVVSEDVPAR
jgi:hypothetical protein